MADSLSLSVAFGAGLASFLSPCLLPLVPVYLGYLSGLPVGQAPKQESRPALLIATLLFIAGFSTVFLLLGFSSGFVGDLFFTYRNELAKAAGILIALFGLLLLGFLHIPLLERTWRVSQKTVGNPYLFGLLFGFGWTPCVGLVLGGIIVLAATQGAGAGLPLLAAYSLGLALPFLAAAYFSTPLINWLRQHSSLALRTQQVVGVFFIILGALIFTNQAVVINSYLFEVFERWGIPILEG